MSYSQSIGFLALLTTETRRVLRLWRETLLPPLINSGLYLTLGIFLSRKVGAVEHLNYTAFIIPGLVMMTCINASFSNSCFSLFSSKFQRSFEELLMSPLSHHAIIGAYVLGGVLRALLSSMLVLLISIPWWPSVPFSPLLIATTLLSTAILFALAGYFNGMLARRFDDLSVIPNFVLTPLSFLGGVFFSVNQGVWPWRFLLMINPIARLISLLRYGFWGQGAPSIWLVLIFAWGLIGLLWMVCSYLTRAGYGLLSR